MKQLFQQILKICILLVFVFWTIFCEFYIKCRLSSSTSSSSLRPPPQTYEGTANLETCFSRGQGVLGLSIFVHVILQVYPAATWLALLDDFCVCSFPVTCLFLWFFISFDVLSTFNVLQMLTFLWQSTVRWNYGLKASHSCLF